MTSTGSTAKGITSKALDEMHEYAHGHERPLGSFLIIMGAYGSVAAGMAAYLGASGRHLPDKFAWSDLALLAVATHKASRQLAKDPVTSPLRAPFTRFSGTSAEAELDEQVREPGCAKRSASWSAALSASASGWPPRGCSG